jgi:hypothetical protein
MSKLYIPSDLTREVGMTTQIISWDLRKGHIVAHHTSNGPVFTQEEFEAACEYYRERQRSADKEGA